MNINVNINISISNSEFEQFKKECKLIYLDREYNGFIGDQKWAIITDLSEEKLRRKYVDVLEKYIPYILLSKAQGEPILESNRNNNKFDNRIYKNNNKKRKKNNDLLIINKNNK